MDVSVVLEPHQHRCEQCNRSYECSSNLQHVAYRNEFLNEPDKHEKQYDEDDLIHFCSPSCEEAYFWYYYGNDHLKEIS